RAHDPTIALVKSGESDSTFIWGAGMKPSTQVKDTILRFYDEFSRADAGAMIGLVSREPGVVAIGTDPLEWWDDHDRIHKVWETQLKELGGAKLVAGDPQAREEGSVGWAADRPTLRLADGTDMPMR